MKGNAPDCGTSRRMDTGAIAAEAGAIELGLRAAGKADRAARGKAYLKSDLGFAGAPVPAIRSVARARSPARPGLAHSELLGRLPRQHPVTLPSPH
jgi:hypothetical protein